jgi:thiol-disulfide isomerase/thioredoxin
MKHSWLLLFLVCFGINAYSQKGNDDLKYGKMPKPAESTYFITGQMLKSFSAVDINGNKIVLNDLKGKVVVINFWFIECPPCRMEIPELNKIAVKYATDPGVVFVAIAMDDKDAVNKFIKTNPFGYRHIDNGKTFAGLYKINLFPTNIVLDKNGKVLFHSSGYAPNTPYWITKSIEEAKQKSL